MENNVEAQNVYWRTPKAVHETEEAVNSLYAVCVWHWLPSNSQCSAEHPRGCHVVAGDNAARSAGDKNH
jgi:hypothetical protein